MPGTDHESPARPGEETHAEVGPERGSDRHERSLRGAHGSQLDANDVRAVETRGSCQVRASESQILAEVMDLATDPPPKLALTPRELAGPEDRHLCGTLRHAPE